MNSHIDFSQSLYRRLYLNVSVYISHSKTFIGNKHNQDIRERYKI